MEVYGRCDPLPPRGPGTGGLRREQAPVPCTPAMANDHTLSRELATTQRAGPPQRPADAQAALRPTRGDVTRSRGLISPSRRMFSTAPARGLVPLVPTRDIGVHISSPVSSMLRAAKRTGGHLRVTTRKTTGDLATPRGAGDPARGAQWMTVLRYGHLQSAPVVVDACLRTEREPPTLRAALCYSRASLVASSMAYRLSCDASVLAATKNTRAREFPDGAPRQEAQEQVQEFVRDVECYDCRLVYLPSRCTGHVKVTATAKKYWGSHALAGCGRPLRHPVQVDRQLVSASDTRRHPVRSPVPGGLSCVAKVLEVLQTHFHLSAVFRKSATRFPLLVCPHGLWASMRHPYSADPPAHWRPSRESDARLQAAQKFSSSLRSPHAYAYLPFISVGSSWPLRPGTLCMHSPRALVFLSLCFC